MTFIACNGYFGYNKIQISMLESSINCLFQLPFSYYYLTLTFGLVSYVYVYSRDFFLFSLYLYYLTLTFGLVSYVYVYSRDFFLFSLYLFTILAIMFFDILWIYSIFLN